MSSHTQIFRAALFAASALGSLGLSQAAFAQDAAAQTVATPQDGDVADIVVSGGTLGELSGSGLSYSATFTPAPSGS